MIQLVWVVAVVISEPVARKAVAMAVQQLVLKTVQQSHSQRGDSTVASVVIKQRAVQVVTIRSDIAPSVSDPIRRSAPSVGVVHLRQTEKNERASEREREREKKREKERGEGGREEILVPSCIL